MTGNAAFDGLHRHTRIDRPASPAEAWAGPKPSSRRSSMTTRAARPDVQAFIRANLPVSTE
ncbi:hypothetical protein, partial [Acinetobacter baumannii]|uniref:hypothetical protein n=1 Tax=Acinetobacter baumannii TaxID=470 RepID=UPI001C088338